MSTHSKRRYQVVLRWRDKFGHPANRWLTKTVVVWADSADRAPVEAMKKADQWGAETTVTPL